MALYLITTVICILSVNVYELSKYCQLESGLQIEGHKKQRHHYMANSVAHNLVQKCGSILNPLFAVHNQIIHAYIISALYYICHVIDIEFSPDLETLHPGYTFHLTLKLSIKVTHFI